MNNFIQVQTKMTISHLGRGTRQGRRQKKDDTGLGDRNKLGKTEKKREKVGGRWKQSREDRKQRKTKDRDAGDPGYHCWKTAPSHQALNRE